MSKEFFYSCVNCGHEYMGNEIIYLCPECKSKNDALPPRGVLKVLYNYDRLIRSGISFNKLFRTGFMDLLPVKSSRSFPHLKVGNTPLYCFNQIQDKKLPFSLFLKDDSQNPTFSFKDRASFLVSAFAKEHHINTIITASTGNAGSSVAGISAANRQNAIVVVPSGAPLPKLTQIIMYGALLIPVKGNYDDAFNLSVKITENFGLYNRNTAFNPLTIEGKKTVSFELFQQLDHSVPDRIFVPVGDGVIISGVYKGFEDLFVLNLIDKIPAIVAVQAEGSSNVIKNLESDKFKVHNSQTIADSISVDFPRNFYMVKNFLKKYHGEAVSVTDKEILHASKILSSSTGIFAEPAAAAAFAGFLKYRTEEKIHPGSKIVVLLTGSGLKDIQAVMPVIRLPEVIDANPDEIKILLKDFIRQNKN